MCLIFKQNGVILKKYLGGQWTEIGDLKTLVHLIFGGHLLTGRHSCRLENMPSGRGRGRPRKDRASNTVDVTTSAVVAGPSSTAVASATAVGTSAESSSKKRTYQMFLATCNRPQPSPLERKRKQPVLTPRSSNFEQYDPKNVSPWERVQENPNECLQAKNGKLWCQVVSCFVFACLFLP